MIYAYITYKIISYKIPKNIILFTSDKDFGEEPPKLHKRFFQNK